jgi:hypothetical protein
VASLKWEYRFAMRVVVAGLHPMRDATTLSGTPRSSKRVMQVCRKSCIRQLTPAVVRAVVYATFHDVIAVAGVVSKTCGISSFPLKPTFSLGNT